MEMIESTIGADVLQRKASQEVLEIPHPHLHVGPEVGPTTHLSLPYLKLKLKRAGPIYIYICVFVNIYIYIYIFLITHPPLDYLSRIYTLDMR